MIRWKSGYDLPRTTEHHVGKPRSKLNNLDKTLDLIRLGEERVRHPSLCWIGVSAGIDSVR